ncbi:hypothetical protein [Sinorhizobium meliloti]|uniref:hypothetical protein n=1 Tax=Rhizobium meliloti TaxID=382 RepID=UPI0011C48514|nr:hypothetical protein [Sinorhizobium meliloti]
MVTAFLSALLAASHATAEEKIRNRDFENQDCIIGSGAGCPDWVMTGNAAVHGDGREGKGATVGGLGSGYGTVTQNVNLLVGNYAFSFSYKAAGANIWGETAGIVKIAGKTVFAEMLRARGTEEAPYKEYQIFVIIDQSNDGPQDVQFIADNPPNFAGPLFRIDDVSLVGP